MSGRRHRMRARRQRAQYGAAREWAAAWLAGASDREAAIRHFAESVRALGEQAYAVGQALRAALLSCPPMPLPRGFVGVRDDPTTEGARE